MPVNKSAQLRFEVIEECLRNTKKRWSKTDILKYLNRRLELKMGPGSEISLSQLRYDLEHLQTEYGAPIERYREGRNYYYKYEDSDFSIKNIPIEDEDFTTLSTAVNILHQLKGFTIAKSIEEVVTRIGNRSHYTTTHTNHGLVFDHTPYTKGIDSLEDLYTAINHETVLKINYHPYNAKSAGNYVVHPYLLKEYQHRWYLLGLNHKNNKLGTFALDRIRTIKVSNLSYTPNTIFKPEIYFNDIIGITKPNGAKVEKIDLLFSATFSPYVISQPLHTSQQILEHLPDGRLHVSLKLIINHELVSLLLSFGKELMVLGPDVLSLELQGAALMMLENYTSYS